jgi:hypothetical protein
LIEYLSTKLSAEPNSETRTAIEELIREQLAQKCGDLEIIGEVADALYTVKICDPAIGSGAYPMGILNVIYKAVQQLYVIQRDTVADVWNISAAEWQPHLVKKNIIQHSIYGVDIESGAVDIARLRFWLALVVDETEPLPLPNLDYKIMQGNSLLESFEGIDLSQINAAAAYEAKYDKSGQVGLFSGEVEKKVEISAISREDMKALMDSYFLETDPDGKKKLHKQIDEQVIKHIGYILGKHREDIEKKLRITEKKLKEDVLAARTAEQRESILTIRKPAKEVAALKKELDNHGQKEIKLAHLSNSDERPFFLWHLFFQEIFEAGGFDIVIGNPPYGAKISKTHQSLFREKFQDLEFKIDSYQVFVLHANTIAKESGCISYIIPSGLMDNFFSKKIRRNLLNRRIVNLIELDDNVFENAVVHAMIITWKTNNSTDYEIACNVGNVKQENFYSAGSNYFEQEENANFSLRKVPFIDLLSRLEINTFRLENVLKIKDGIDTGNNNLYVSDNKIEGWKKLIGGSDIERWKIKSNRYVNYGDHLANPRNPELFENDKVIIRETGNKIIAAVDSDSFYALSTLYSGYLINNDFSLKSILGLLHSEISHFLMVLTAFGRTKGAFTKTRIFHYYSIPVHNQIPLYSDIIDKLVDSILISTKTDSTHNEQEFLEKLLNNIFYIIYLNINLLPDLDNLSRSAKTMSIDTLTDVKRFIRLCNQTEYVSLCHLEVNNDISTIKSFGNS